MTERQLEKWVTPEGEAEIMKSQCLKRKLYPDDISRVVLFLASEHASFVTGAVIPVDGGYSAA